MCYIGLFVTPETHLADTWATPPQWREHQKSPWRPPSSRPDRCKSRDFGGSRPQSGGQLCFDFGYDSNSRMIRSCFYLYSVCLYVEDVEALFKRKTDPFLKVMSPVTDVLDGVPEWCGVSVPACHHQVCGGRGQGRLETGHPVTLSELRARPPLPVPVTAHAL